MAGHIHPLVKRKVRKSLCIATPACDGRLSLPALFFLILLGHKYSWKHREARAYFTSALNIQALHGPSPTPESIHWVRSSMFTSMLGITSCSHSDFFSVENEKCNRAQKKIPAMLYSWDYLVVPNVTGVYSPASPKESKLPPDWTVWRQELCFPFMALHCWTLVTAGGLSIAIHHHSTGADFKLWSKKERKNGCYSGGDKQNVWHYYSNMSITIVHFCLRGLWYDIQNLGKSYFVLFCILAHCHF